METVARKKNKTAMVIAIALAVLGVLIAVGGGAAILWLRSTGPNDAYEVFVTQEMPLGAGDMVTFTTGNQSCTNVSVLGTRPDGRVIIEPCEGDSRPTPVDRALLRLPRFPANGTGGEPEIGDVVLTSVSGRFVRAEIVAPEPNEKLRLRPLRIAPHLLGVSVAEIIVARGDVLLVQRKSAATARFFAPVGEGPLMEGDTLVERTSAVLYPVTVVAASANNEDVRVRRPSDAPELERSVARDVLTARSLRPFDEVAPNEILLEPTAGAARRVVVRSASMSNEVCVADQGAGEDAPCRNLPKTGVRVVRTSDR